MGIFKVYMQNQYEPNRILLTTIRLQEKESPVKYSSTDLENIIVVAPFHSTNEKILLQASLGKYRIAEAFSSGDLAT